MLDTRQPVHDGNILDLIHTICQNGESGRLEILAGAIQGELSFKDGKLVDARVGRLTGFQAVNAAAAMQNARASFDPAFTPLASGTIKGSERVVLKQFFGIETADSSYVAPAVLSVPQETAKTVFMDPVPDQADEVTIVRSNSVSSALPPPPPPRSRFSYPLAAALAALVIGITAAAGFLLKGREGSATAVAAATESSAPVAAAPVQQSEPRVEGSVPAAESVPAQSAPAHTVPAHSVPAQSAPSRSVPTQAAPVQSAPASPRVKPDHQPNTIAQNLSGKWNIVNTVETTSYNSFKNLKLGFDLSIDQNGTSFTGRGLKVSENGRTLPVKSRTPIEVKGSINGDRVEAIFYEHGTARNTNGKFVWRIDSTGRGLTGSFNTTAARSRGKSAATKTL